MQFWAGKRFYVGAWHALRGGGANMDVLVALGTSMAYLLSAVVTLFGLDQHVYFEAGAAVITLVLMGKLLEARAKAGTSAAIEELVKLQPKTARIERDGEIVEVDAASLKVGRHFHRPRRRKHPGRRRGDRRRFQRGGSHAHRRKPAGWQKHAAPKYSPPPRTRKAC